MGVRCIFHFEGVAQRVFRPRFQFMCVFAGRVESVGREGKTSLDQLSLYSGEADRCTVNKVALCPAYANSMPLI